LYIGEYVNNQRSGEGIWLFRDLYRYEGEWSNDKPNGRGTVKWLDFPDDSDPERVLQEQSATGTLVEGLWNGSIMYIFDEYEYNLEFVHGEVESVEFERDDVFDTRLVGQVTGTIRGTVEVWADQFEIYQIMRSWSVSGVGAGGIIGPGWRLDGLYGVYQFAEYSRIFIYP